MATATKAPKPPKAAKIKDDNKKFGWKTIVIILVFIVVAVVTIWPLYMLFVASLRPGNDVVRYGLNAKWDLEVMSLNNYKSLFDGSSNYLSWYKNSVVITGVHVVLCLFLTSMVGYAIGIYRKFRGRGVLFLMVLIAMMIPIEVLMLPMYNLINGLGLINTYAGVILPFVVAPTCIFFFRQYVEGLPVDFLEAGRIDGCSEYGIYFRIYLPLMLPAFTAMLILQAMNSWNNLLWPMLVLRTSELQTLPIGLRSLITPYGNNYEILISGAVMAVLPILLVYLFFQRYFIEGMTSGGVKG